jgi:hypothetical protein
VNFDIQSNRSKNTNRAGFLEENMGTKNGKKVGEKLTKNFFSQILTVEISTSKTTQCGSNFASVSRHSSFLFLFQTQIPYFPSLYPTKN